MRSFKISVIKLLFVMAVMLMLGTSIAFAQVSVSFPTVSGAVGTSTTVPITVGDLTGQNVYSYQFNLFYDKNIIDVTGVETAGTKSESGQISSNTDLANGKLSVAWANSTALTGSGTLLKIKITFKAAGVSDLDPMATFLFNSGVPAATITKGKATAATIQVYVDNVSTSGLASEILIPVKTTALAATDNVYSFDLTGTFDATKIELTGYSLTGTKGEGGQAAINYNNTTGTYSFAWANATKISGDGILFYLKAKAKAKAISTVSITTFKYNSGLPVVVTADGILTVTNKKPVFDAATQTVNGTENTAIAFSVNATDGDNDVLTYSATGLPTGATLSAAGAFAWTPSFTQAGTYTVVVTATDGTDNATLTISLVIADVNRTPTITLTPAGPFTVAENSKLTFKVVGTDLDTDNTLTLSATGLPTGATFTAATGDFVWTPTFAQAGVYTVSFKVEDNKGSNSNVEAVINVTDVNTAPSFTVVGAKQLSDTTIAEGQTLLFNFKAIDAEGDLVTYYKIDPTPSASTIDAATGLFSWTPAKGKAGDYQVVIIASDGRLSTTSRIIKVKVTALPNTKPVITAIVPKKIKEGELIEFTVKAIDAENDMITFTATGLPTGATFVVDKFKWTPSYLQAGSYKVTFLANDGYVNSDPMVVDITVDDVNRVPTLTTNPAGPIATQEGQIVKVKVIGTDLDTDNTLTLSATGLPSGATFTAATGDFVWTPTYSQAGSFTVKFSVKDNNNASATLDLVITVANTNTAPRFDVAGAKQMPDTTINAGKNFVFTYKAVDAESDVVTYYLQNPLQYATIVSSTGVFGWRPANTQAGKTQIVVLASDGVLTTASRIAYVTVIPDPAVEESGIPTSFELLQNYPNPFNPTTNIKYALPKESRVRIAVFNILGQEVATLVNSVMPAGYHSVDFKANNIPSGMYIYKIETESFTQVKKMLLMK